MTTTIGKDHRVSRQRRARMALALSGLLAAGCRNADRPPAGDTASRPAVRASIDVLTPEEQALILRLQTFHALGRFSEGIGEAENYLSTHPQAARVNYVLGALRGSAGDHLGAIAAFEAELKRDPGHLESKLGLATAYTRSGNLEAALAPLREVRLAAPERADAAFQLGRNLSQLGRFEEAAQELEEAAKLGYGADAEVELGLLYRRQGDSTSAERAFRLALARDPRRASALLNLGQVLQRSSRAVEAAALLERQRQEAILDDRLDQALSQSRLRAGEPSSELALAAAYRAKGRLAEAVHVLDEILKRDPGAISAALYLADLRLDERDLEAARRLCLQVLLRSPDNGDARFLLGLTRLYAGERQEGDAMIATSRKASAWKVDAFLRLGDAYLATGDLDAARVAYEEARTSEKQDARPLHALGTVELRAEHWEKASHWLERALALDRERGESWLLLALAKKAMGEEDTAALDAALAIDRARLFSAAQANDALSFLDAYRGGPELRQRYRQLLKL